MRTIGSLVIAKDPSGKVYILELNDTKQTKVIGDLDLVKTKINIKDISFDVGRYKNMILLAIGDADGFLSIFSLLTLNLLERIKLQKDQTDIAVM